MYYHRYIRVLLVHRDGSAVELIGLCASVTRWLADLSEQGKFPHSGVKRPSKGLSIIIILFVHMVHTYKHTYRNIAHIQYRL